MKKIGDLNAMAAHFEIYYDEKAKYNPYKIYNKWYYKGWHKQLIEKYADLFSCTEWINNFIRNHNEDGR